MVRKLACETSTATGSNAGWLCHDLRRHVADAGNQGGEIPSAGLRRTVGIGDGVAFVPDDGAAPALQQVAPGRRGVIAGSSCAVRSGWG